MTFGQFIRQKRIESGLTQTDIASHLGYNYMMVSRLESGQRQWKLNHIVRLAELLDIRPWQLLKEWDSNLKK